MSNNKTYPGLFNGHLIDVFKVLKRCHHKQQDGSSDIWTSANLAATTSNIKTYAGLFIGHVKDIFKTCHYEQQQDLPRTAHGTCHRRPQSPQNLPPCMSNKKTYPGLLIGQVVGVLEVLELLHRGESGLGSAAVPSAWRLDLVLLVEGRGWVTALILNRHLRELFACYREASVFNQRVNKSQCLKLKSE